MTAATDVIGTNSDRPFTGAADGSSRECTALHDRELLATVRRSKLYRAYERAFTEATGLPLALRPVEFFGLAFQGHKNENPFCACLAGGKSSSLLCLRTQQRIAKPVGDQPRSVQCPFGLTESAVPVRVGQRVVGFLCTGQVFTRRPTRARSLRQQKPAFAGKCPDQTPLRLWNQTKFVEPAKYKATVQLLTFFAKELSALSNQLIIEQKYREPQVVTRARQFIAENKRGRLTLAAVAKAAGASMFHFCTLFHQTTGLKLSEYVARCRIEDSRTLLCNPTLRMNEVAYETGFQSVSAFNRTFRRIVGQSPSEYRAELGQRETHHRATSPRRKSKDRGAPDRSGATTVSHPARFTRQYGWSTLPRRHRDAFKRFSSLRPAA